MSKNRIDTAESLVGKGNSLFVDEQFDEALEAYTGAIDLEPDFAPAYLKRSACHYSLKNFADSIADANKVITLQPNGAEGYFRKGMGLFAEEEYESAKAAFTKGKSFATDAKKYNTWIRKCDAELDEASMDVTPTPAAATIPAVVQQQPTATAATTTAPATTAAPAEASSKITRFRHEWFQTDSFVNVDVFAKGVKPDNLSVVIEEQNLTVTIKLDSGSDFVLDVELADKIVPAESTWERLSTKIEIKLKKARVARWKTLENTGEAPVGVWDSHVEAKPSAYPSSKGTKNWDAIAKSEEDDKLTGDHALNKLFKDIYKDASDEQRKAMMKSYVESNGTVLSTNWDEVGSGEVKGSAPAGMEMHSWNDDRDAHSSRKDE